MQTHHAIIARRLRSPMKKIFLSLQIITLLISVLPSIEVVAQGETPGEPESGAVVCPPDVYLSAPGDCLPLGPSTYLTELSQLGLTFPQRAVPVFKPDPTLPH